LQQISHDLVKRLSLRYEPVGVTLYKETDELPEAISFTEKDLKSYCQALILAGEGEVLLLKKEQMGCRLKSSIEPCDLMLGSPGDRIEIIHKHILDMEKPIGMLAKELAVT
jgi:uncharacterized protein (DUF169 family)